LTRVRNFFGQMDGIFKPEKSEEGETHRGQESVGRKLANVEHRRGAALTGHECGRSDADDQQEATDLDEGECHVHPCRELDAPQAHDRENRQQA
jgi:hypothetical protein